MSTVTTTQPAISSPLRRLIKRYPLLTFFVLAFGLTWPFLIADALGSWGLIPFRLPVAGPGIALTLLAGYGPTFAALIVAGAASEKAGIRTLLRRLLMWRVGIHWYAVAIFLPGVLFFIPIELYTFFGGTPRAWPTLPWVQLILTMMLLLVVQALINGEEIGWRGYALPRLQGKYNALTASLILGVIWALFHLPLFLTHGGGAGGNQAFSPPLGFLIEVVSEAILVTWVYNNTRGSVLLIWLFHAAVNSWPYVLPVDKSGPQYWLHVGLICLAAVIVVVVFGPARLSRKPDSEMAYVTDPVGT